MTFVAKGPLREFDTKTADGLPIPILTMGENAALAKAVVELAFELSRVDVTDELRSAIEILVGPVSHHGSTDAESADRLIATGTVDGRRLWSEDSPPTIALALLNDFRRGFLLVGLLPAKRAGERQVLKFSFHWGVTPAGKGSFLGRVAAGFGLRSRTLELRTTGASDTSSYHLEFHTPPQIDCQRLELPPCPGRPDGSQKDDRTLISVAHAHDSYDRPPESPATVELSVARSRVWTTALLSAATTAIMVWLAIFLPGAKGALLESSDGAAALLLAVPAVVIGFAAGGTESALAVWLLGPLRLAMIGCAAGLMSVAGSIVGELHESFISVLWWTVAVAATVLVGLMVIGPSVARERT
ncbi:hypothetical protein [uncultured Cellulomonas sp.]|uniref:hypothetical protein n=1 Tax=uncultured Cellulomonas sp. TaxID=189682 RepID=UPI0028E80FE1|nr:hypothetical protein [uncultured Cellulomonas sp.]